MEVEARDLNLEQASQPDHQRGEPIPFTLMSLLPSDPIKDSHVRLRMPRFVFEHRPATAEDHLTLPTVKDIDYYQREHNVCIDYAGPYRSADNDYSEASDTPVEMVKRDDSRSDRFSGPCPDGTDFTGADVQVFPEERS
jgi:hypothetical protein